MVAPAASGGGSKGSKGKLRGFPPGYKKLTPSAKASWLGSEACEARVKSGLLQHNQVTAERRRLEKAENKVLGVICSSGWLQAHRDGYPVPPPNDREPDGPPLMVKPTQAFRPEERNQWWPKNNVGSDGMTFDLATKEDLDRYARIFAEPRRRRDTPVPIPYETESPSAESIMALEQMRAELSESPLPPEDDASLEAEVLEAKAVIEGVPLAQQAASYAALLTSKGLEPFRL